MKDNTVHSSGTNFSRSAIFIDSDAAMADAHITWDSITDAQHQHDHDMMMMAIAELEDDDLKNKRTKEIV